MVSPKLAAPLKDSYAAKTRNARYRFIKRRSVPSGPFLLSVHMRIEGFGNDAIVDAQLIQIAID